MNKSRRKSRNGGKRRCFLAGFSALSALSAGLVQQFMVNYMKIHVKPKHEWPCG